MKVILIVVFSITIIKILPPLASVLRSPKVTGPGYRTSVLQLGPMIDGVEEYRAEPGSVRNAGVVRRTSFPSTVDED